MTTGTKPIARAPVPPTIHFEIGTAVPSVTDYCALRSRYPSAMKALLHCRDIERGSGKIEIEQLWKGQWREHRDALEIGAAGGADVGPAEGAFSRAVKIGELLVARLSAAGAAQARKRPCSQTPSAAKHPLLLRTANRRSTTPQLGEQWRSTATRARRAGPAGLDQ